MRTYKFGALAHWRIGALAFRHSVGAVMSPRGCRLQGRARGLVGFGVGFLLASGGLFCALPAQASVAAVGTIPGSFGVTPTGAATYAIPIRVPRGSGGLTPSITLVYNSQSGSGAAGWGWTLAGLSAITRCNKTIDDDGVNQAVQLTSNDDYCLDGQRLRSTGADTYDTELRAYDPPRPAAPTGPIISRCRPRVA